MKKLLIAVAGFAFVAAGIALAYKKITCNKIAEEDELDDYIFDDTESTDNCSEDSTEENNEGVVEAADFENSSSETADTEK